MFHRETRNTHEVGQVRDGGRLANLLRMQFSCKLERLV